MPEPRGPGPSAGAGDEAAGTRPREDGMDLVLAGAIALAAGLAALYHPTQVGLRTALAVPALLVVPGYVLLQAALPAGQRPGTTRQLGLSVGISPAIVGLVALATAVTPWGFQRTPIVLAVMLVSVVLSGVAGYRRAGGLPGKASQGSRDVPGEAR